MTDDDLLDAFVHKRSQDAFGELVRRYGPMVLSIARRSPGATEFAEDIAQGVFVALATKAGTLKGCSLAGWLYRATGYAVRHTHRTAARRKRHEVAAAKPEAVVMPYFSADTNDTQISDETFASLDAALRTLSDKDRSSVLQRFTRGLSFAQVGSELGVSEEAARKRVARAVGKLKQLMVIPSDPSPVIEGLLSTVFASPPTDQLIHMLMGASGGNAQGSIAHAVLQGLQRAKLLVSGSIAAGVFAATLVLAWSTILLVMHQSPKPAAAIASAATSAPTVNAPLSASAAPIAVPISPAPQAAEPPLGGARTSSFQIAYMPQPHIPATGVQFVSGGVELAQMGGDLNGTDGNFTGHTYLEVYDLDLKLTSTSSKEDGFPVYNAAFSSDGRRAIFSCIDWNRTGRCRLGTADFADDSESTPQRLATWAEWFMAVAISNDGQLGAAAPGQTTHVDIWNLSTRKRIGSMETSSTPGQLAFDPAGKKLVTGPGAGASEANVQIWDVATCKRVAICQGHTGYIRAMAVSPDGAVLATADSDGAIWFWSMADGKALKRVECAWEQIEKLAFSPDSKRLLVATDAKTDGDPKKPWIQMARLRLWDVATGSQLLKFEMKDQAFTVIAFMGDGHTIVTDQNGMVRTWDVPDGLAPTANTAPPPAAPAQPRDGEIAKFDFKGGWSVAFSPDGESVFAGGMTQGQSWNLATGKASKSFVASNCLQLLRPDLDLGLDASYQDQNGFVQFFQLSTGKWLQRIVPNKFPYVEGMDLSPDGRLVAMVGGGDKEQISPVFTPHVVVFTIDGSLVLTVDHGIDSARCVKFSVDGKTLYIAKGWRDQQGQLQDCVIRSVDVATGKDGIVFQGMKDQPKAITISTDGKRLWAVGAGGVVDCWDTVSGHEIARSDSLGQAYCIAASPDGKMVAVGLAFNNVILLDTSTCTATRRLRRHQGPVLGVAFSADSKRLASVSTDKTVRVWDLR